MPGLHRPGNEKFPPLPNYAGRLTAGFAPARQQKKSPPAPPNSARGVPYRVVPARRQKLYPLDYRREENRGGIGSRPAYYYAASACACMACRTAASRQVFFRRTGRHGNRRRTSVREGGAFSVQSYFRLWDISINTETFTTVRYLNAVSPYYSDIFRRWFSHTANMFVERQGPRRLRPLNSLPS